MKLPGYFLLAVFLVFCTRKKGIPIVAAPPVKNVTVSCDTINISYVCTIKPILGSNCYSCHSSSASDSGKVALDLENFSSLKNYLKLFYRNDSIYGSKFYHVIMQAQLVIPMPPAPQAKLSDTDIRFIKKWLNSGAPEN